MDRFNRPEGDGGANDEQTAKESHQAGQDEREIERFERRPADVDQPERQAQDQPALEDTAKPAQDEFGAQDLQADIYRAQ